MRTAYKNELYHHGIKGQKWGVRRFQNPDGSLTYAGKARYRAQKTNKTRKDVDEIVNSLSEQEQKWLGTFNEGYLNSEQGEWVVHRVLKKHKDQPVGFFDLLRDGDDLNVALAVRNESEYRGKGVASDMGKKAMKWAEAHPELWDNLTWGARPDNIASRKLAEKLGFELASEDKEWALYKYKNKGGS